MSDEYYYYSMSFAILNLSFLIACSLVICNKYRNTYRNLEDQTQTYAIPHTPKYDKKFYNLPMATPVRDLPKTGVL
jgi:hypothetical protein